MRVIHIVLDAEIKENKNSIQRFETLVATALFCEFTYPHYICREFEHEAQALFEIAKKYI